MNPIDRLRLWWMTQTGEEETPFDGDTPAWLVSLFVHLVLLIVLTLLLTSGMPAEESVVLSSSLVEEEFLEPEEFMYHEIERPEVGANSLADAAAAEAMAPIVEEFSELEAPEVETDIGEIEVVESVIVPTATTFSDTLMTQGVAGHGTTGAMGALDRLTQEIKDSMDTRPTMVVWLFDQSISLSKQRVAIYDRIDQIYDELGVIEAANHPAFTKHEDKPLLTSVMAFGSNISFMTKDPTDQIDDIKAAIAAISDDETGVERVFGAVKQAADKHRKYAMGANPRNVMIVIFTDEAGDDAAEMLDLATQACRTYVMPVYCVGIPSPFGREDVEVKWVDPDPDFDQSAQWSKIRQGPESFLPERLKVKFSSQGPREEPLDSGFGPFHLTRLCVETGGIYFSVHPNRQVGRHVTRNDTEHLSAYIKHFFDPEIMRSYKPDYVSASQYNRVLRENAAKEALVQASSMPWIDKMTKPKTWFPKRSEAALANDLTEAQREAAKLEPRLAAVYNVLTRGAKDRDKILRPRWKAGFDLAMGQILAIKVRTVGYNHMLAEAKRGMEFQDAKNDTWSLEATDEVLSGSAIEKEAELARMYLQRVVDDHPGTPWALLAQEELADPMGWKWIEKHTGVNEPRPAAGNNNNPQPRDDQRRMIDRKPKREPPKL